MSDHDGGELEVGAAPERVILADLIAELREVHVDGSQDCAMCRDGWPCWEGTAVQRAEARLHNLIPAGLEGDLIAATRRIALLPAELEAVQTVEELTGVGLSQLFHQHFAPQIQGAARLLREMNDAAMTVDRGRLTNYWATLTPEQSPSVYAAESDLLPGE